jgi:hypothetical protein
MFFKTLVTVTVHFGKKIIYYTIDLGKQLLFNYIKVQLVVQTKSVSELIVYEVLIHHGVNLKLALLIIAFI